MLPTSLRIGDALVPIDAGALLLSPPERKDDQRFVVFPGPSRASRGGEYPVYRHRDYAGPDMTTDQLVSIISLTDLLQGPALNLSLKAPVGQLLIIDGLGSPTDDPDVPTDPLQHILSQTSIGLYRLREAGLRNCLFCSPPFRTGGSETAITTVAALSMLGVPVLADVTLQSASEIADLAPSLFAAGALGLRAQVEHDVPESLASVVDMPRQYPTSLL